MSQQTTDASRELLDQLKLFLPVFAPREERVVVELRALGVPGWKPDVKPVDECGFFDLGAAEGRQALAKTLEGYVSRPADRQPEGLYLTINPIDPVFLARANNRMGKKGERISAEDKHVLRRRWVVIDADPKRPIAKISATDDEKAAARVLLDGVREDLCGRGWCDPMVCDSGNGFHAWYRIDLPTDDGKFVEHTLKALARRHDTDRATVDTGIFNPSRILKIPGTWARKGSSLPDRPHRMCRVLELPEVARVPSHAA